MLFISLTACKNKPDEGLLIITEAPAGIPEPDFINGDSWRMVPGARIIAIDPDNPGSMKILTTDFNSACFPEISYDGKYMLFAGHRNEGDTWQIWEMKINKQEARQITSSEFNCIDPAYLPGDRIVFTRLVKNDTVKEAYCLYTCNLDGSAVQQITFGPSAGFATSVLKDGRLLTVSRQLLPEQRDQVLSVMRPDGTKADMFWRSKEGGSLLNRARETADGKILFIEMKKGPGNKCDIISVSYNRPLHSGMNLTSETAGDFNSVLPLKAGDTMVSYRKPDLDHYSLYEFNVETRSCTDIIYENHGFNVLDAAEAVKHERPKRLPSEVDKGVKTGLLLCQDINVLYIPHKGDMPSFPKASRIEVTGVDSSYGIVDVEKDGSFYLKVMADTPFQIRTLNKEGQILNGPCTWLWLRPNERRGCTGCHEDPELVPENRVPEAVRKAPVIIPVHISDVREKIVELE